MTIQDETANMGQMAVALSNLAEFLYRKYDEKCIVLIDEYDTPFNKAYERGYTKSVIVDSDDAPAQTGWLMRLLGGIPARIMPWRG